MVLSEVSHSYCLSVMTTPVFIRYRFASRENSQNEKPQISSSFLCLFQAFWAVFFFSWHWSTSVVSSSRDAEEESTYSLVQRDVCDMGVKHKWTISYHYYYYFVSIRRVVHCGKETNVYFSSMCLKWWFNFILLLHVYAFNKSDNLRPTCKLRSHGEETLTLLYLCKYIFKHKYFPK